MNVTWIGHACFLIESKGDRILTDPFNEKVPYNLPETDVDVVTVSHEHFDHNAVARVAGSPIVVRGPGKHEARGIRFSGIASAHDDQGGSQRGSNTIFAFALEGVHLAHLGDLGAPLDESQRRALADVEILFIPVGGHFTIDAQAAADLIGGLPALRIAIPMHFKTNRIGDWPIAPVDAFEELVHNPRRLGHATATISRGILPSRPEVWILDHA